MNKIDKLLLRLLRRPKDFTFKELAILLSSFGFELYTGGKTIGSAVRFINHENGYIIRLHKPHPQPELKPYLVSLVINELKKGGYINGE